MRQREEQDAERGPSQATRLVNMAVDAGVVLFHTPDGDAYGTIPVDTHDETWPIRVRGFRRWLSRLYYQAEKTTPGSQAVQDALGVLEGIALFDGEQIPVFTRLAESGGAIYLDLVNDQWQAVEVDTDGWRIVDKPPVKFRRAKGMLPLPLPEPGGTLEALRPFLNLKDDADWVLTTACLLAAFRPVGPYPVMINHGEQGSAKSTEGRVIRSLIDPNEAMLRTPPREERDLVIAAKNGWVIALDSRWREIRTLKYKAYG